ncbi:MAG: hypothetical protein L6U99_00950 [Clostridium sp.]|nr:MAG: hypothetical protein L6U99_00950 [Clostridium sp.]
MPQNPSLGKTLGVFTFIPQVNTPTVSTSAVHNFKSHVSKEEEGSNFWC